MGGGPAGLAAAFRLSRDPDCDVLLIERAPRLGGLAAGMRRGDSRLDFGPHRLHPAVDREVMADLRDLLGAELQWRRRAGLIFAGGRYLPFPPNLTTLQRLGMRKALALGRGLLAARLGAGEPTNYAEAVTAAVGRPLYELLYGPYAEKVWGLPGEQIAVEQARRRVNQRGLADFLLMLIGRSPSRRFLYPRGGFGRIPEAYAEVLAHRANVRLLRDTQIRSIEISDRRITTLQIESAGGSSEESPSHVVWTAPIPDFTRLANVPAPIAAAAGELRTRAVIIAYAELSIDRIGRADTYYFPDPALPFNRVMEQKQFSDAMVPAGRTVLVMDLACDATSDFFSRADSELRQLVSSGLETAGLCGPEQIADFWTVRFRSAYPVYTDESVRAFGTVRAWLDGVQNLWLAGRQGLFLHNNTHHSLYMGYRAAAAAQGEISRTAWLEEVETFADFTVAD